MIATNDDMDSLRDIQQVDSTGAGDAFFGGIIAGIYHFGIPQKVADLLRIGNITKCTGAASIEVLGGLPVLKGIEGGNSSRDRLVELDNVLRTLVEVNPIPEAVALNEGTKVRSM